MAGLKALCLLVRIFDFCNVIVTVVLTRCVIMTSGGGRLFGLGLGSAYRFLLRSSIGCDLSFLVSRLCTSGHGAKWLVIVLQRSMKWLEKSRRVYLFLPFALFPIFPFFI